MPDDELEGERDWWTWAGLGVVGAAAAVLSFSALADLARRCGVTGTIAGHFELAWLLPLTLDVFAATATRIWLRRRACDEAIKLARGCAWAAIGTTVAGNAYHGYLLSERIAPPLLAVMVVAAVAPVALGALGALVHLAGRPAPAPLELAEADRQAVEDAAGFPVFAEQSVGATIVYRLFDELDELLYVGLTNDVMRRWKEHSLRSDWWSEVVTGSVVAYRGRHEALAVERRAIRTERPRHNSTSRIGDPLTRWQRNREPWSGPIASHEGPVVLADMRQQSDRGEELTDEQLVALVAAWAAELGEVPKREPIRLRYRIGSPRADRIRAAVAAAADSDDSAGEGA